MSSIGQARSTLPAASAQPEGRARADSRRTSVRPALAIAGLLVSTRAIAFVAMLWAKHGDVAAAVQAASRLYDSAFYDLIVLHGYAVDPLYGHAASVFYPGYPLVVAAVYWPLRFVSSLFLSGSALSSFSDGTLLPLATLLVCNVALVAALAVLWRLYLPRLGEPATLLGVGFLLTAPTSFFLSNGFSESLFVLAIAVAFLQAEKGRWISAGAAGAAACLIRFPGAFLVVPLALIWFQTAKPRPISRATIGAGTFAVGAIAYPAWLWATSGDALAYLHLQQSHHRSLAGPVHAVGVVLTQARDAGRALLGRPSGQRLIDVPTIAANSIALVAGAVTTLFGWTRLRAYEVVWVALVFLVPLVSGTGESLDRYWLAAFPFFFLLGWWLRRWPVAAFALMGLSAVWLFVLSYNFARIVWVG